MKKFLLTLLLLFTGNAYAQNWELRTFAGKLGVVNNVYTLVNKDVRPDEQLSINPNFVIQKDQIAIGNRCRDYCVIRARAIRGLDITGKQYTWWLVKVVFINNPPNPNP